jgi:large conductance mechanosensitive channel
VNSLVTDVLLPPISLLPFLSRNIQEKFVILQAGPNYNATIRGYNTLQQASDDGAVTLGYGSVPSFPSFPLFLVKRETEVVYSLFISNIIRFFAVALALYLIAQGYSKVSHDSIITKTTKCGYCCKFISLKVRQSMCLVSYAKYTH